MDKAESTPKRLDLSVKSPRPRSPSIEPLAEIPESPLSDDVGNHEDLSRSEVEEVLVPGNVLEGFFNAV